MAILIDHKRKERREHMETISNFETNTLYYGDCLEIMKDWEKEQVDLIYLDPPFNSNADYNVLFKPGAGKKKERFAQKLAFVDTWNWNAPAVERVDRIVRSSKHPACRLIEGMKLIIGETGMLSYISYMADRLEQCHRVLKKTGSIYFHCDDTASHYLKLLMDAIFGAENFRNQIVWQRVSSSQKGSQHRNTNWGRNTDTILYYAEVFSYAA